jgi:hypothetical protein
MTANGGSSTEAASPTIASADRQEFGLKYAHRHAAA